MSLWLTENELRELTGKVQRSKQIAVLAALVPPVRFRVRPADSFPLVDRAQFEVQPDARRKKEPNYG